MSPNTFTQRGGPATGGLSPLVRSPLFLRSLSIAASLSRQSVYNKSNCLHVNTSYTAGVPKLWSETIEAHRRGVREAILDTTAALAAEYGLLSVTMSQIAEQTGIGRATLYKYFPDVESIVRAWHERQVGHHLHHLAEVRDRAREAGERLEAVLEAYALIHQRRGQHQRHHRHGAELATFVHRDEHVSQAEQQVLDMIQGLLAEASEAGDVRDDVPLEELARYCLHALAAASGLLSEAAARRLVEVVLAGLRPTVDSTDQQAAHDRDPQ